MIRFTGPNGMVEAIREIKMYSDGTPMVKTAGWARIVDKADTVTVQPTNLSDFVTAMFLVDAVNDAKWKDKGLDPLSRLVLPYLPGARQDRSNPTGDVLFTARSIAKMINSNNFERVVSLDPHSEVMPNLIYGHVAYPLGKVILQLPSNYDAVIAPDKGGVGRASLAASVKQRGVVKASKVRDVSNGRLTGFDVTVDAGKHYLVSDDICDGGGTFIGLGEKIIEQGATADLFVSHGIFSKGTDDLTRYYDNIYTTDSLLTNKDGAKVIHVVNDMETF